MTSVVSGIAINLFNQSPMKNCDKKRCILLLLFSRVLLMWGREKAGNGVGGVTLGEDDYRRDYGDELPV